MSHDHIFEVFIDYQRVVGMVENIQGGMREFFLFGLLQQKIPEPVRGDVIMGFLGHRFDIIDGAGGFDFAAECFVVGIANSQTVFLLENIDIGGIRAGNGEQEIRPSEIIDDPLGVILLFGGPVIEIGRLTEEAVDIIPDAEILI